MKNTNSLLSLAFLSLGFFGSNAQAALTNRIALDTTTSYASKAFTQRLGAEVSADVYGQEVYGRTTVSVDGLNKRGLSKGDLVVGHDFDLNDSAVVGAYAKAAVDRNCYKLGLGVDGSYTVAETTYGDFSVVADANYAFQPKSADASSVHHAKYSTGVKYGMSGFTVKTGYNLGYKNVQDDKFTHKVEASVGYKVNSESYPVNLKVAAESDSLAKGYSAFKAPSVSATVGFSF